MRQGYTTIYCTAVHVNHSQIIYCLRRVRSIRALADSPISWIGLFSISYQLSKNDRQSHLGHVRSICLYLHFRKASGSDDPASHCIFSEAFSLGNTAFVSLTHSALLRQQNPTRAGVDPTSLPSSECSGYAV